MRPFAVGEADNNVPPESTYRVADALIKAKKTFEFLPLPGFDHTDGVRCPPISAAFGR